MRARMLDRPYRRPGRNKGRGITRSSLPHRISGRGLGGGFRAAYSSVRVNRSYFVGFEVASPAGHVHQPFGIQLRGRVSDEERLSAWWLSMTRDSPVALYLPHGIG